MGVSYTMIITKTKNCFISNMMSNRVDYINCAHKEACKLQVIKYLMLANIAQPPSTESIDYAACLAALVYVWVPVDVATSTCSMCNEQRKSLVSLQAASFQRWIGDVHIDFLSSTQTQQYRHKSYTDTQIVPRYAQSHVELCRPRWRTEWRRTTERGRLLAVRVEHYWYEYLAAKWIW